MTCPDGRFSCHYDWGAAGTLTGQAATPALCQCSKRPHFGLFCWFRVSSFIEIGVKTEVNPIWKRDARISRSIIKAAHRSRTASTSVEYRCCRIARPSV